MLPSIERFATDKPDEGFDYISKLLGRRARLLDYSNFRLSSETTALDLITINVFELSAAITARSTGLMRYALSRIDRGGIERAWNSRRPVFAGPGEAILDAPENETLTHAANLRFTAISIAPDLISAEANGLIGEPVNRPLQIYQPVDLAAIERLNAPLAELIACANVAAFREDANQAARIDLQRKVISALISETNSNIRHLLGRNFGGRPRDHVRKLKDYLSANLRNPISLGDVCMAVGVSDRTLQESCDDLGELPPMKMLDRMRLYVIRQRLEDAAPEETVESIAREYCFTHMGDFGKYYRRIFGETPRRARQRGRRKNG